jgi:hypothetical protein
LTDGTGKRRVSKAEPYKKAAEWGCPYFEVNLKTDPYEKISKPFLELVGRYLFWKKFNTDSEFQFDSKTKYWNKILDSAGLGLYNVLLLFLANKKGNIKKIPFRIPEEIFVLIGIYLREQCYI